MRHDYLRATAEEATRLFITRDLLNVKGIIVAGPGLIKEQLLSSELLDPRIQTRILAVHDIAGELKSGFYEACAKSAGVMNSVRMEEESKLLASLMNEMSRATNLYAVGLADTVQSLQMGMAKTVLLTADCKWTTVRLTSPASFGSSSKGSEVVFHARTEKEQEQRLKEFEAKRQFGDTVDTLPFARWLAAECANRGADLELIRSTSPAAVQFSMGLGGVAAILRYPIAWETMGAGDDGDATGDNWDSDSDAM